MKSGLTLTVTNRRKFDSFQGYFRCQSNKLVWLSLLRRSFSLTGLDWQTRLDERLVSAVKKRADKTDPATYPPVLLTLANEVRKETWIKLLEQENVVQIQAFDQQLENQQRLIRLELGLGVSTVKAVKELEGAGLVLQTLRGELANHVGAASQLQKEKKNGRETFVWKWPSRCSSFRSGEGVQALFRTGISAVRSKSPFGKFLSWERNDGEATRFKALLNSRPDLTSDSFPAILQDPDLKVSFG